MAACSADGRCGFHRPDGANRVVCWRVLSDVVAEFDDDLILEVEVVLQLLTLVENRLCVEVGLLGAVVGSLAEDVLAHHDHELQHELKQARP